jgi:uncharacterized protein YecE (DUF72 family)
MATPRDNVLLGTSGWSYKEWIGPFYAEEDKSMLRAYCKVFRTVEIDSTFYGYPSKGTVMGWAKYSPEGFVYTAKLPKLITHKKKLDLTQNVEQDLQKFIELIEPLYLDGKLGCVLIQLPPRYSYKPKELEDFLKILPTQIKFAVEFRDSSWVREETWVLLQKYKVAYTIVDEPLLPPELHFTSNFAYFRWHGRGTRPWYNYRYSDEELEPWIPKIKEAKGMVEKVYGYFNNHYHGYAVENCLQVLKMLDVLTTLQREKKSNMDNYFKTTAKTREPSLESFIEPEEMTLEKLLRSFMDAERLKRAQRIKDNELTIQQETDDRVRAIIRGYHLIIDLKNRVIFHDCADWSRILSNKQFCKHLGKLVLSLNKEKASNILKQIYADKESWQFKTHLQ